MQIPNHIIIQKNLEKLVKAYSLRYSDMSRHMSCDQGNLNKLITGKKPIGLKMLEKFAKFFSVSSHELLNPKFEVISHKQVYINGKDRTVHRLTKE